MKRKRSAAEATLVGVVSLAAATFGAGMAQADPPQPTPPPPVPVPGHDGPIPQDAVVPMWAPPAPPPPFWAPWLPVVWNTDLSTWGVWWNGSFLTLP
ncbi:hypothetical protein ACGFK1_00890 [Mycobacterium sp. NPDC048908]|uniref:hypothetical protein n=1 Tax=Mycobacterium sp. NPDC048908 TaxID=3364292 RepID=UPI00371DFB30